jgi:aspartyl-tRNA(Asn)/glutamyl-tRNA(Gln) amidotransferase subunit B
MSNSLIKTVANIISTNLMSTSTRLEKDIDKLITKESVLELAKLFDESKINNQGLSKAIDILVENSTMTVDQVVTSNNLLQMTDTASLEVFVDKVIISNPAQVEQFRSGKTQVVGFLVGQCMKESKGQGNPKIFSELLTTKLSV